MGVNSLTIVKFILRTGSFFLLFFISPITSLVRIVFPDFLFWKKYHTLLTNSRHTWIHCQFAIFLLNHLPFHTLIALYVCCFGFCLSWWLRSSFNIEKWGSFFPNCIIGCILCCFCNLIIDHHWYLTFLLRARSKIRLLCFFWHIGNLLSDNRICILRVIAIFVLLIYLRMVS